MVQVRLQKVSHIYQDGLGGKIMPLRGIDITLHPGDTMSLLGPSGSGKSTLLHILGLLLQPTEGEVILDGQAVGGMDEKSLAYLRSTQIGFVFQRCYLIPTLTVRENIRLPLWIRDGKKSIDKEAYNKVDSLLAQLDLEERSHFLPHQLSGGQRRRTALARALVTDPKIILADEPTAELDEELRLQLGRWLLEQAALQKIVVVATHDARLASYAKRRYVLANGVLTPNYDHFSQQVFDSRSMEL